MGLHRLAGALALVYYTLAAAGAMSAPAAWLLCTLLTAAVLFAGVALAAAHGRVAVSTASVLVWALTFRLPFVFSQPVLSDDVWRYLWDGRVALSGVNPYSFAPDDPELATLRDDAWTRVNHRSIPTVYPPFAQGLFRTAVAHGGLVAWKLLVVGFDLCTIAALVTGLGKRAGAPALVLLYAWNPLVIIEFSWSGHVDAAAVAISTWAVVASRKRYDLGAVALASIAAAIKLFPALLLPALLRRTRSAAAWTIPVAIAVAGAAPYLSSGIPAWFAGLRTYAERWEFNGLPYVVLRALGEGPVAARLVLGAVVSSMIITAACRRADLPDFAVLAFSACVSLSPTVHPWYVTWSLPAAILSDRPPRFTATVATLAVLLSYRVLVTREATGDWAIPEGWLLVEWGLVIAVLCGEYALDLRRSGHRELSRT